MLLGKNPVLGIPTRKGPACPVLEAFLRLLMSKVYGVPVVVVKSFAGLLVHCLLFLDKSFTLLNPEQRVALYPSHSQTTVAHQLCAGESIAGGGTVLAWNRK